MAYISGAETHPISEAISVSNNKMFEVVQLADSEGNIINPASGELVFNGDVVIGTEIEISNDIGNPVPISDGGGSITIDAPSLPLPTGAATSAKQDTLITHVDGIESLLATIDADTGSIGGKLPALSDNKVPVQLPYFVSVSNSKTSGGLAQGESWNASGAGDEILQYGTITVCVFSDQDSATNGLVFEASLDGTNWQIVESYSYKVAQGLDSFSMAPSGRYFRVRFVNGSVASTFTRIQTLYRQGYTKSSSHRIGDVISAEKDAELVKAVLAAMKPNGDFTDIYCTAGGNLKVSVEETEGPIPVSDNGGSLTIDATSLPLPTGAATSAKQDTLIGHVDGIEGLLTTIDADTGSIDGKLPALSSGKIPVVGPLTDTELRASSVDVEPLGIPAVARQLSAGSSSANTALTSTCRRISIKAIGADIRYAIGSSSQTASATTHFIGNGERLDLAVPATPNIAVIRNGSANGTLELTELI